MDSMTEEWTIVGPKTRKQPTPRTKPKEIRFDELCEILTTVLSNYTYIVAGFVYGSRARGTNRIDSDVDLLIFWKTRMHIEDLKMVRNEVETALGLETDFVSCYCTKKYVNHSDDRDEAYFENVMIDAKQFMGTEYLADLIQKSVKSRKLSRK